MSKKEAEKYVKEMQDFTKKVTSSSESSLNFLVKAGICNTKGNLKKEYK